MLSSSLCSPILRRKFFSGNNLSSGTNCRSCFFEDHFLCLILHETLRPKLCSSGTPRAEQRKRCMFLRRVFYPSLAEAPAMAGFPRELQHRRKDTAIPWRWLRYSGKSFTDGSTAPVPPPKKVTTETKQLYMHTATTCNSSLPFREPQRQRWGQQESSAASDSGELKREEGRRESYRNSQIQGQRLLPREVIS